MEKIFENFTISILRLSKLISKIKTFEMREYGLKSIHVMCVYYLNESEDGLTASDLSKLALEDKAAISRGLVLLEKKGYAKYDHEKYNSKILLTDSGRALAAAITEKIERAVNAGSASFSESERGLFYNSLKSVADNLNDYYESISK